ncbi:hypothetical protein CASFOL_013121 [Castilleja foliolosa]|uniref:Ribosomal protein L19 n=1 Tax=Castilleja foliolosa TaxID=1961234 RepID=A0ABD3DJ25_9LAMI
MQSLYGKLRLVTKETVKSLKNAENLLVSLEPKFLGCSTNQSSRFSSQHPCYASAFCLNSISCVISLKLSFEFGSDQNKNLIPQNKNFGTNFFSSAFYKNHGIASALPSYGGLSSGLNQSASLACILPTRNITTSGSSASEDVAASSDVPQRIKFKRLDKTARHIMQIIDKEAVEEVKSNREIPEIKPGYIVQLKVEVPENKRRLTTIKGIVIARRNAGLNTTIRIRRLVAGVGIENLFLLYSPNIKEIKVLEKKRVRRAKLYYLRDKMNALKKQ